MYKIHNTILLIRSGLTTNYAFKGNLEKTYTLHVRAKTQLNQRRSERITEEPDLQQKKNRRFHSKKHTETL
ncbi:hypothetical protein glysoja_043323 [Glycine soja]|uniref:Uncharacterized protein n=1 Tax=Glycine soja TaxID=3848 RepID=A0A0B2NTU1_GLYSO|nr:hypothetical protein glysoja_043323 [Glycine soja]